MKNNIQTDRYEELDALRGIAALIVVLFHLTYDTTIALFGFHLGSTGVDLFFIISGFVISMSLNKVKSSKDFIINRMSRLYPTYWVSVSFTFFILSLYAFYSKYQDISIIQYVANMTMFQYYIGQPNIDGPYWTMIIEMIFYILMVGIFQLKKDTYADRICLGICSATVVCIYFLNHSFVEKVTEIIPLLPYLPLFLAGITFYNLYNRKNSFVFNYLILLICFLSMILFFNYFGRLFITQIEYTSILTLYFLLFILFVQGKLTFIVFKSTLFLGKISFALYLIHQCISTRFIIPICINRFNMNVWIAVFFIALPVAIGLAALITYYIDIPLSLKMRQKLRAIFVE